MWIDRVEADGNFNPVGYLFSIRQPLDVLLAQRFWQGDDLAAGAGGRWRFLLLLLAALGAHGVAASRGTTLSKGPLGMATAHSWKQSSNVGFCPSHSTFPLMWL